MTFSTNVPNSTQSPGLFPAQNNTNFTRLKIIIDADHIFNDSVQPTDGMHKKCSFVNQAPTILIPTDANAVLYTAFDAQNATQLYFFNGIGRYPLTPAPIVITGTVNFPTGDSGYKPLAAVPNLTFGEVYLYKARFIQVGAFAADTTTVNGYSYAEKFVSGTAPSEILRLGFDADVSPTGLTIQVANVSGNTFSGTWTYRIFYRAK